MYASDALVIFVSKIFSFVILSFSSYINSVHSSNMCSCVSSFTPHILHFLSFDVVVVSFELYHYCSGCEYC